jgi:hypothetical protein
MNAVSGKGLVYFNHLSVSSTSCDPSEAVTPNYPGLVQQNFPRLKNSEEQSVMIFKQSPNGKSQLHFLYTDNISKGFLDFPASLGSNYVSNGDVAIVNDNVMVAYDYYLSNIVNCRFGTIDLPFIAEDNQALNFQVFPNPSSNFRNISEDFKNTKEVKLWNSNYQLLKSVPIVKNGSIQKIDNNDLASGVYFFTKK